MVIQNVQSLWLIALFPCIQPKATGLSKQRIRPIDRPNMRLKHEVKIESPIFPTRKVWCYREGRKTANLQKVFHVEKSSWKVGIKKTLYNDDRETLCIQMKNVTRNIE